MEKLVAQVREFMTLAGQRQGLQPGDAHVKDVTLGRNLIEEEYTELMRALDAPGCQEALVAIADGIGDLLYVTTWLGITFGLPMEAIMDEIQRANLAKFGPGARKDPATGKVLKPEGWQPPNIRSLL